MAALVESVSFLVLLGIAMPLKYLAGMPIAVKLVGWAHGALFILFCIALAHATLSQRWGVVRTGLIFIAGFVPFGPFLIDKSLLRGAMPSPDDVAAPTPFEN